MKQILNPQDLPHLGMGLFFFVAAGLGNLVMGLVELRIGKAHKIACARSGWETSPH